MTFARYLTIAVMTSILFVPAQQAAAAGRDLEILGWVENAHLMDPVIALKAKLDTGAETSSLDAEVIGHRNRHRQAAALEAAGRQLRFIFDPKVLQSTLLAKTRAAEQRAHSFTKRHFELLGAHRQ